MIIVSMCSCGLESNKIVFTVTRKLKLGTKLLLTRYHEVQVATYSKLVQCNYINQKGCVGSSHRSGPTRLLSITDHNFAVYVFPPYDDKLNFLPLNKFIIR